MPGRPAQNGRHERMHRSLKFELPLGRDLLEQQLLLEHFRNEFNYIRPHEALGMKRPGELYVPSTRPYPRMLTRRGISGRHAGSKCQTGRLYLVEEQADICQRGFIWRTDRA
nr:integrase core domain-containing protein [Pseudomonas hygromyciniae]